jgi:FkbM family methyltransferase
MKLYTARVLYRALRMFLRADQRRIRRKGIYYDVDLAEGIELSLFLFGHFQSHVLQAGYFHLPADAVILDVGANIGSMALHFAQLAPQGRVYAFEPTHYAAAKLRRNLALNPALAARIEFIQAFVSDRSSADPSLTAYSSWKLNETPRDVHPVHGGSVQSAAAVPSITIDAFCEEAKIQKVNLIKIDTDGHEFQVLQGAHKTIAQCLPSVVFEVGLYLLQERGVTFDQYYRYFSTLGYALLNSKNGRTVTSANYRREIPLRYTTDLLALPPGRPRAET